MIESRPADPVVVPLPAHQSRPDQSPSCSHPEDQRCRFDRLCAPLREELFRFVVWLTRDRSAAEDVVQDTLMRAWTRLGSLKHEGSVKPWLLKIARREAARHYGRKRHVTASLHDLVETNDPALAVSGGQEEPDVRAAIFALERDYREPLVLQVLLGLTTAEIAEVTGVNPATVLTRLFRARNKLRAVFHDPPAHRPA